MWGNSHGLRENQPDLEKSTLHVRQPVIASLVPSLHIEAAKQETTMTGRSTLVAIAIFVAATMVPKVALAQKLSDAEVKRLATSTATAADHKKLAAHYRAHAAEHEADAFTARRGTVPSCRPRLSEEGVEPSRSRVVSSRV